MITSSRLLEIDGEPRETVPWSVNVPPEEWRIALSGLWVSVTHGTIPKFGWKVHVSSTLEDAPSVLAIASEIAFARRCSFKHLRGLDAFISLHFKNHSRLQSGKFIALYPADISSARALMEQLYESLSHREGIDVLTDRAFKGSTNVFYRFGAFVSTGRLNGLGIPEELIPDGTGRLVADVRLPRFALSRRNCGSIYGGE